MATGNGAYILHKKLEKEIPGYSVRGYNPYLTLMPLCLKAAVNTGGAEVIHTTPDYAWFFMKRHIPTVITFHNYVLDPWMTPYSSLAQRIHYKTDLRLFIRFAVAKACTITAVSHFVADLVQKDLGLSSDIQVIYNGIDSTLFYPRSRKNEGKIRVFFSGNLSLRKGAQWLAAIADRLNRNVTIYYTSGLRAQGLLPERSNMVPIGSVPYTGMPACYNTMDILLMPTVREGFGLAVAEAMACGLPVVVSDCSAIPELITNNKGGFLCPVGDVNAFAEKINNLADSPNLRRQMGDYNRARVETHFSMGKMISEYEKLFQKIVQ
jgi:glycosyltransferase involved in cell wall biosynthesis